MEINGFFFVQWIFVASWLYWAGCVTDFHKMLQCCLHDHGRKAPITISHFLVAKSAKRFPVHDARAYNIYDPESESEFGCSRAFSRISLLLCILLCLQPARIQPRARCWCTQQWNWWHALAANLRPWNIYARVRQACVWRMRISQKSWCGVCKLARRI